MYVWENACHSEVRTPRDIIFGLLDHPRVLDSEHSRDSIKGLETAVQELHRHLGSEKVVEGIV